MSRVVDRAYGEKEFPPSPYNTQFTTRTLLLFLFWFGTGMTVWSLRQPWSESYDSVSQNMMATGRNSVSPDGSRCIRIEGGLRNLDIEWVVTISHFYKEQASAIYEIPFRSHSTMLLDVGFIDNDRVLLTEPDGKTTHLYKRRFPEYWWGHFYRPELWIFVAFSLYMCWRIIKYLRNIPDITK